MVGEQEGVEGIPVRDGQLTVSQVNHLLQAPHGGEHWHLFEYAWEGGLILKERVSEQPRTGRALGVEQLVERGRLVVVFVWH